MGALTPSTHMDHQGKTQKRSLVISVSGLGNTVPAALVFSCT